jgi:hypothetical protein
VIDIAARNKLISRKLSCRLISSEFGSGFVTNAQANGKHRIYPDQQQPLANARAILTDKRHELNTHMSRLGELTDQRRYRFGCT